MIDDELRPIVTEFVVEMLNDPRCKSIMLDVGEDATVDSELPVLYLEVAGKRYGCMLTVVEGEYSAGIRNSDTNETITMVKGRAAWRLQELFAEIKTRLWEDK